MFIEIDDVSTGVVKHETLNAYSINYVYARQEGSKYNLIYVLTNGIRKIEEFNNQSDLNDRIAEIEELSGGGGTNVYTYKGSCTFENLPTSDQVVGDVWNITNDFTLGGKSYPAGTNVAWDGTDWDALAGSIDLSNYYTKVEVDELVASGAFYLGSAGDYDAQHPLDLNSLEVGVYAIDVRMKSATRIYVTGTTAAGEIISGDYDFAVNNSSRPAIVYFSISKKVSEVMVPETGSIAIGSFSHTYYVDFPASSAQIVNTIKTIGLQRGLNNTVVTAIIGSNIQTYNVVTRDGAQTITGKKTFSILPESNETPTKDAQLVTKKYVDEHDDGQTIQYTTMPIASSSTLGMIVEYVGTTDANYTNGYFYKCVGSTSPAHDLTKEEALAGITRADIPETFTVTERYNNNTTLEDASHNNYVMVNLMDTSGEYSASVTISMTGVTDRITFSSVDGYTFTMDDTSYAGIHNFPVSVAINYEYDWYDFLGPVLKQPAGTGYSWQRIDVQPGSDMSNYYTKSEIDAMIGDIADILSTLTTPSQVE